MIIHFYSMLMASVYWYQLVFLSQVWYVSHGVPVNVTLELILGTYGEDVLLPCKAHRDPEVTYSAVSWYKIDKNSDEWKELLHNKERDYSGGLNESFIISNDTWDSLEITNVTCYSTGTYKCVLRAPVGNYNQNSTITLKVTDCPEEQEEKKEEDKTSNYRTELVLLFSLALFYLLLICFTCTCLTEKRPSNYHKCTKNHTVRRPDLISTY
ncbi:CD83 antigen [Tiliqua scincoides]|uniref:CD83 antigen n=1 Tax=Tiliqua scincoides TaxID=71010 RepID=UPI003461AD36